MSQQFPPKDTFGQQESFGYRPSRFSKTEQIRHSPNSQRPRAVSPRTKPYSSTSKRDLGPIQEHGQEGEDFEDDFVLPPSPEDDVQREEDQRNSQSSDLEHEPDIDQPHMSRTRHSSRSHTRRNDSADATRVTRRPSTVEWEGGKSKTTSRNTSPQRFAKTTPHSRSSPSKTRTITTQTTKGRVRRKDPGKKEKPNREGKDEETESSSGLSSLSLQRIPQPPPLHEQVEDGFMRVILSFVLFPFTGIVPLIIYIAVQVVWALIEIISGFATLGASVLQKVDSCNCKEGSSHLLQAYLVVDGFIFLADIALHIGLMWIPAKHIITHPPPVTANPFRFIAAPFQKERILFFIRLGTAAVIKLFQVIWLIVGAASLATQRYMKISNATKADPSNALPVFAMMNIMVSVFGIASYACFAFVCYFFFRQFWAQLRMLVYPIPNKTRSEDSSAEAALGAEARESNEGDQV